ncbi:MAG TPA: DinB family protein [Terriglobales bacterium]|jgi:uncharacterized damage-inducible protein DinB
MSQVPRWFERKFDLSFPAEMYPNLCARLRGTPARIEELARSIPREILVRKAGESWSAQENAGHLFDLEHLWLARTEDYVNGSETLTATDLANRKTGEANYNARRIEDILADFRKTRNKLMQRLEGLEANLYTRTALHPRLKTPMRLVDHLYFVAEHDDHHLACIWKLAQPRE